MTRTVLTRDQVRRIDEIAISRFGIPGLVLMENAGRGCVDVMTSLGIRGPIAIACGRGNNAGDGFVIARRLATLGFECKLLLFNASQGLRGDAAVNFDIAERLSLDMIAFDSTPGREEIAEHLAGATCIVDALLGTGAVGPPRAPLDLAIESLNACNALRIAIDLPSGLDCDTGTAAGAVFRADHTCTFVAPKPGLILPAAREFVGTLHVIDIGVPADIVIREATVG